MKVAIIEAGTAGLACAYQLYKHGITPTIFEQKEWLGETLDLPAIEWLLSRFDTGGEVKHDAHSELACVEVHV